MEFRSRPFRLTGKRGDVWGAALSDRLVIVDFTFRMRNLEQYQLVFSYFLLIFGIMCSEKNLRIQVHIAYDVDLSQEVAMKQVDLPRDHDSHRDVAGLESDVIRLAELRLIFVNLFASAIVEFALYKFCPIIQRITSPNNNKNVLEQMHVYSSSL